MQCLPHNTVDKESDVRSKDKAFDIAAEAAEQGLTSSNLYGLVYC